MLPVPDNSHHRALSAVSPIDGKAGLESLRGLALSGNGFRSPLSIFPAGILGTDDAIVERISTAVLVRASLLVSVNPTELRNYCTSALPELLAEISTQFPDKFNTRKSNPVAWVVIKLSDGYLAKLVAAEKQQSTNIAAYLSAIKDPGPQLLPVEEDILVAKGLCDHGPELKSHYELDTLIARVADTDELDLPVSEETSELPLVSDPLELDHELRFQEYIKEKQSILFEALPLLERMSVELYFFHGFSCDEIASVIDQTPEKVHASLVGLRSYFSSRYPDYSLVNSVEAVREEIDREDLGLEESQGLTLLSHWLKEYPRLRRTAEILNLIADSPDFFSKLFNCKSPEIIALCAEIIPPTGIDRALLGRPVWEIIRNLVIDQYPLPEDVRFEPTVARLIGVSSDILNRWAWVERDAVFLKHCILTGIYSPKVHKKSKLYVRYGNEDKEVVRHVRNPLTRVDVVDLKTAEENSTILLRRCFPNLDAIRSRHGAGLCIAKSMLDLAENATIYKLRRALVAKDILSGEIPANYEPNSALALSAYFDVLCVGDLVEKNRDAMIRRCWANIDDPERDPFMARVLGVPNTLNAIVKRAMQTLGTVIPDRHPFKYNQRTYSRYFDVEYVEPIVVQQNLAKALRYTFVDLKGFTLARVAAEVEIGRLARFLNLGNKSFRDIKKEIERLGYLS